MKHKFISLTLCLIVILALALPVSARTPLVHDYANLLTSDNEADLAAQAQTVCDSYGISVVILTTPTLYGQEGAVFADNFYENNHFGEDRILFLVDIDSRQWYISTMGSAADLISEKELDAIEDKVIPYLSDGKYYEAFSKFYDLLPRYLDVDSETEVNFLLSLVSGAAIAGVILLIMKGTMNTKTPQRNAASYEAEGSYHLYTHQDLYLYSNVTKRPKPQNNSSGGSHHSSGGRAQGGRGGKF